MNDSEIKGGESSGDRVISHISVPKSRVFIGEPVRVKVFLKDEYSNDVSTVKINGIPGERHFIQFTSPGEMKITAQVGTVDGQTDRRSIDIEVVPRPNDCDGTSLFPIIELSQNFLIENGVTLRLGNEREFEDRNVYYVWEIGDETHLTSPYPYLNYSLTEKLDNDELYTVLDVVLHVKTRDDQLVFTGRRSVTVWNTYELSKARGVIQPRVTPDIYAHRDGDEYVGRFTIENLENEDIEFDSVQVDYLYDDPERVTSPKPPVEYDWTLGAGETSRREFTLSASELPSGTFGFAAHFRGYANQSGMLAIASCYFEVKTNPRATIPIDDEELVSVIDTLRSQDLFRDPNGIPMDKLKEVLEKQPDCSPVRTSIRDSQSIDYDWVTRKLFENIYGDEKQEELSILSDGGDLEGMRCSPEDEVNPEEDLVCQLTDERELVVIPARILNARKGDVVLSPGGNGPIGNLLRQVDPAQVYSHCGVMVNNYYRIKHSTASEEWVRDAVTGTAITGDEGTEGLDPDKLKFAWPGTIEQSIDEAYDGSTLKDPNGEVDEDGEVREYEISAFKNETKLVENIGLVEPLVVKPDPFDEANDPEVRSHLHRIAESAKEFEGHYRFFCYTSPEIFFDDEFLAPDEGEDFWASGTFPTVCSSFIWAAAKRLKEPEISLEGPDDFTDDSDLEPGDKELGADVDFRTRDGLYFYDEDERREAGDWLYTYFYNLAFDKAGRLGNLGSDAADDLGNQICNTFTFDWTGVDESGTHSKDSDRWKNPGEGHAVSPDNIRDFWDAPVPDSENPHGLYGYSERLLYRPARLESRRISRWTRVEDEATLSGTVLYRGNTVAGALVRAGGDEDITGPNGEYELTVPAGSFSVEAGKTIDELWRSTRQDVAIEAGETLALNLTLKEPDELFRNVSVRGSMFIVDDERFRRNPTATRDIFMGDIFVGPFGTHAERSQIEKMGGEIRVELELDFDWQPTTDVEVSYSAILFEGTSTSTTEQNDDDFGTIVVPADKTVSKTINLVNRERRGGDTADITLHISNEIQP